MSKGRDKILIQNRDRRLAARFYYYNTIIGLRYDRAASQLEKEFDIAITTISNRLTEVGDIVSAMEINQTTTEELKSQYPFMNWRYVPANWL